MKTRTLVYITIAASVLILAMPFIHKSPPPASASAGLPWQIDVLADGKSRVFSITLDESTVEQVAARLAEDPRVAVIAATGQPGALEAYFEKLNLGLIGGRIMLATEQSDADLLAMQKRAVKIEPLETGNRRYTLTDVDHKAALKAVVHGVAFMPEARLEEKMILDRFGPPAERITVGEMEHFLYPAKGLDVVLGAKGRAVLQYVSPGRFARIREPLHKARTGQ